jgi:hypothetical protein
LGSTDTNRDQLTSYSIAFCPSCYREQRWYRLRCRLRSSGSCPPPAGYRVPLRRRCLVHARHGARRQWCWRQCQTRSVGQVPPGGPEYDIGYIRSPPVDGHRRYRTRRHIRT